MSASDHLEPKLFHGSTHWFTPGETIEPRTDLPYNDVDAGDDFYSADERAKGFGVSGAYATVNYATARGYSSRKLFRSNLKEGQGSLFAPVYEVGHLSEHSDPSNVLGDENRRDLKGFHPKRIAGYAHWNDIVD